MSFPGFHLVRESGCKAQVRTKRQSDEVRFFPGCWGPILNFADFRSHCKFCSLRAKKTPFLLQNLHLTLRPWQNCCLERLKIEMEQLEQQQRRRRQCRQTTIVNAFKRRKNFPSLASPSLRFHYIRGFEIPLSPLLLAGGWDVVHVSMHICVLERDKER